MKIQVPRFLTSVILLLSCVPLSQGALRTITFNLVNLNNNVNQQTLVSENGNISMTITATSDWGGNTNAINVNSNGLLVTEAVGRSFTLDFDFSNADDAFAGTRRYLISGFSVADISTVTAGGNFLQYEDSQARPFSWAEDLSSSRITQAGDYDSALGHQYLLADNNTVTVQNAFMNDDNAMVRFSKLRITYDAVPEPAAYALLLGGMALAGAALRRHMNRNAQE